MPKFKLIPDLDKNEGIISLAQTPFGKLIFWALFSFLIIDIYPAKLIIPVLLVTTFLPKYRKPLLTFSAVGIIFMAPIFHFFNLNAKSIGITNFDSRPLAHIPEILFALGIFMGFYWIIKQFGKARFFKRPITLFLSFLFLLMCGVYYIPLNPQIEMFMWVTISVLCAYTWHFTYSLMDIKSKKSVGLPFQSYHYFSLWGVSATPYAKGSAYLRKIEAKDDRDLALSQLKAIKLALWGHVLKIFSAIVSLIAYSDINQPSLFSKFIKEYGSNALNSGTFFKIATLEQVFKSFTSQSALTVSDAWISIIIHFIIFVLAFTIAGHFAIAICRFAGFNALRNTYNPLKSASIADFWNRYYYYFKELLVDVFFYPTFLRYFKKHPRLRMFFATFCAAGLGNFLYHYLYELDHIMEIGPFESLIRFKHYFFYSTVLALGIAFSQLRHAERAKKKIKYKKTILNRAFSLFVILLFFLLVFTYHDLGHGEHCSELERIGFMTYLFGF